MLPLPVAWAVSILTYPVIYAIFLLLGLGYGLGYAGMEIRFETAVLWQPIVWLAVFFFWPVFLVLTPLFARSKGRNWLRWTGAAFFSIFYVNPFMPFVAVGLAGRPARMELTADLPAPAVSNRVCHNCGGNVLAGQRFCVRCGDAMK